jgi:2-oxoglutarate ferredoxin oxidoreductase subunit beta
MSEIAKKPAKPAALNRLGLELKVYKGADSTLCNGCGHDSITGAIVRALYEKDVAPHMVAKLSGIGCSSKTTAYFLGRSHGFNAVHGRMAAIAAGVHAANRKLVNIGVSGDGDTASIGLGNFMHMLRRNVPIVYIIENNGCYGLTKGQFSATADKGSLNKGGTVNEADPIDLCALAVEMGCGFVARSFSGDLKQLVPLLKAAISHRGAAVLDVVSPCVTFNNHEGSTKSYPYAKEKEDPLHEIGFVPHYDEIHVDYDPGTTKVVTLHDGSKITLKKLGHEHDPHDHAKAVALLERAEREKLFLTGLIYQDTSALPFDQHMGLVAEPLATLPAERTRPSDEVLARVMERFS